MGLADGDKESGTTGKNPSRLRYNSLLVQVIFIGFVGFCCPGMFNTLSGMVAGGQVDPTVANKANTALYTTFAVFSILGGGFYNILGPHLTLASGCSTYALYARPFLYYNHYKHQAFAVIAGSILGIGAGFLWAEKRMLLSLCSHERKR